MTCRPFSLARCNLLDHILSTTKTQHSPLTTTCYMYTSNTALFWERLRLSFGCLSCHLDLSMTVPHVHLAATILPPSNVLSPPSCSRITHKCASPLTCISALLLPFALLPQSSWHQAPLACQPHSGGDKCVWQHWMHVVHNFTNMSRSRTAPPACTIQS
jgi:hypothetical protein